VALPSTGRSVASPQDCSSLQRSQVPGNFSEIEATNVCVIYYVKELAGPVRHYAP